MTDDSDPAERDGRDSSNRSRSPEWVTTGWGGFESPFRHDGDVPDFRGARRHLLGEVIHFAARLRLDGVSVPVTGSLDAARALSVVGLADRDRVAAALRTALVTDAADLDVFEERFPDFWRRLRAGIDAAATAATRTDEADDDDAETEVIATIEDAAAEAGDGDSEEDGDLDDGDLDDATPPSVESDDASRARTDRRHASDASPSRESDENARRFSSTSTREAVTTPVTTLTDAERAAIDRFVDTVSTLPGRRQRRGGNVGRIDARLAFRAALETGGAPMELPRRRPLESERRICLLLDVSGSVLDTVDRATLLAFAEAVHARSRRGRVFLFDDEFADVTEQFDRAAGDPARALRSASIRWGGGTQIGEAFDTVRREHPHAVDRDTITIVVSDGLDVGDGALLRRGVTWLSRRSAALCWLNPLAVAPTYEPVARGMEICVPYVDALFGFATPADLTVAAAQLERHGLSGPVGFEYDRRRFDRDREQPPPERAATAPPSDDEVPST